jgi:hypothetical protein
MLYKIINDYIKKEKINYEYVICRRKERFLLLIELDAPKELITQEIELLRQPFRFYIRKRFQKLVQRKIYELISVTV